MLRSLFIQNYALIDKLDIDFENGFSVITGETGAGKSIIIDAINAVTGQRTSKELIRTGCDKGIVSALFDDISDECINKWKTKGGNIVCEGNIEKICAIENEHIYTDEDYLSWYPSSNAISKASHNIIDLIEVGDYVNGKKVYESRYGELYIAYVYCGGLGQRTTECYATFINNKNTLSGSVFLHADGSYNFVNKSSSSINLLSLSKSITPISNAVNLVFFNNSIFILTTSPLL